MLGVAALGWMFDCLDQQLFALARQPAMKELLAGSGRNIDQYGGYATAIFLLGWASGGLVFGVLGDRIGRARTMLLTILLYSACTGLSALSHGFWDFTAFRFLTGLGVGGEFAVGVALVAEVMPDRARPYALAMLQALSTVGNIAAALIGIGLAEMSQRGMLAHWELFGVRLTAWRVMFLIGALPALLALPIRRRLKEPERWEQVATESTERKSLGSYRELFGDARWRRRALAGMVLAAAGVIGLWGIAFYSFDLSRAVFGQYFKEQGLSAADSPLMLWASITAIMLNIGGFFGMNAFGYFANWAGRRAAFAVGFVAAMLSTAAVFRYLGTSTITIGSCVLFRDVFWLVPILPVLPILAVRRLCGLFSGCSDPLRSTGTSFCYNVGRFLAASGPYTFGPIDSL